MHIHICMSTIIYHMFTCKLEGDELANVSIHCCKSNFGKVPILLRFAETPRRR